MKQHPAPKLILEKQVNLYDVSYKSTGLFDSNSNTPAKDKKRRKDAVDKVVSVNEESGSDVLWIEDVLNYLPVFAQLNQFNDGICTTIPSFLSETSQYVQNINEWDEVCNANQEENHRLDKKKMQVKADARCAFTEKLVLEENEPFYVFPSGFVALESALKKVVRERLNAKKKHKLYQLEKELAKVRITQPWFLNVKDNRIRREQLQNELDCLIAAECPLTGSMMVETIDKSFPGMHEDNDNLYGF